MSSGGEEGWNWLVVFFWLTRDGNTCSFQPSPLSYFLPLILSPSLYLPCSFAWLLNGLTGISARSGEDLLRDVRRTLGRGLLALCEECPHAAWPEYGASCKLGEDWDLESRAHRQKCSNQLRHERPRVLIASPLCTSFSVLQDLDDGNSNRL